MLPNPRSTASIAGHPIHPMLVPFPIAFLVGALVTDIVNSRNGEPLWAQFSFWLLAAGIATALLAAIFGFIDLLSEPRIRALRVAWFHMVGNLTAVVLSAINLYLRLGDNTLVPSAGLPLSLIVVLLLVANGWMGGQMVYVHRVAVTDDDRAESL
jgi:uncharacterized membrane protein